MLDDGTVFDTSYGGKPFSFDLGKGQVIEGWDIGVASMLLGERAELTIESDYGYGRDGRPPKIPGYATLIFEVELVGISEAVDEVEDVQVSQQAVEPEKPQPVEEPEPVAEPVPEPVPEPVSEPV